MECTCPHRDPRTCYCRYPAEHGEGTLDQCCLLCPAPAGWAAVVGGLPARLDGRGEAGRLDAAVPQEFGDEVPALEDGEEANGGHAAQVAPAVPRPYLGPVHAAGGWVGRWWGVWG